MKTHQKIQNIEIVVIALILLTFIEAIAIANNTDGYFLSIIVGAICALVGYVIPKHKKGEKKNEQKN